MTTNTTTGLIPAEATRNRASRHRRGALRIRILTFFAIDKTMRAGDTLSPAEVAARREALLRLDAVIREQAVLRQQYFIR